MSKTTMVRHQTFTAPIVAGNTNIHAAITLPASGTTVVTTNITNPDVPRTVRLKANQASVNGLVVIVAGTDILDQALSESVTMGAFATATDTLSAFKTVTSITVPTRGASSDTVSVGFGASLGFDCYLDAASIILNAADVTSKTISATTISRNVFVPATTLDGATDIVVAYIPSDFPTYDRIWG